MTILLDILVKFVEILAESAPYILLGFLIAGILHVLLPESLFQRLFSRAGIKPLLRAIGMGSLIPVCSCGVVPIGIGAYRAGAGVGTVLAFMTAAPALSPASVLLSWQLLGRELTLWQALFVGIGSFSMGLLANQIFRSRSAHSPSQADVPLVALDTGVCQEKQAIQPSCCGGKQESSVTPVTASCCDGGTSHVSAAPHGIVSKLRELFHWLFVDFGPSVTFDMLLGLTFAATVLTLVPEAQILQFTGSGTVWSLLLVILVALPVYTCSMAAIPVVFGFLTAGMSPGAAVAFLIGGPATNFGEMNALRNQIGWKTALYYLISLLTISVGAGLAIDHWIHPVVPALLTEMAHNHSHGLTATTLQWLSMGLLGVMVLTEIGLRIRRWRRKSGATAHAQESQRDKPQPSPALSSSGSTTQF